jgi:hypothetical protein
VPKCNHLKGFGGPGAKIVQFDISYLLGLEALWLWPPLLHNSLKGQMQKSFAN